MKSNQTARDLEAVRLLLVNEYSCDGPHLDVARKVLRLLQGRYWKTPSGWRRMVLQASQRVAHAAKHATDKALVGVYESVGR